MTQLSEHKISNDEHDSSSSAKKVLIVDSSGDALKISPLTGSSAMGSVTLTSANTWYEVPSTVPTNDYMLIVTLETLVGDIRFSFNNTSTPSTSNGNLAPSTISIKLGANQKLYFGSTSANDVVNWTTKEI